MFEQLDGPVDVPDPSRRDDMSLIEVPQDSVAYITGKKREALGQIERDMGSLMFFLGKKDEKKGDAEFEKLAIFGDRRARLASLMRVLFFDVSTDFGVNDESQISS